MTIAHISVAFTEKLNLEKADQTQNSDEKSLG
jgi:hypothetical protein